MREPESEGWEQDERSVVMVGTVNAGWEIPGAGGAQGGGSRVSGSTGWGIQGQDGKGERG